MASAPENDGDIVITQLSALQQRAEEMKTITSRVDDTWKEILELKEALNQKEEQFRKLKELEASISKEIFDKCLVVTSKTGAIPKKQMAAFTSQTSVSENGNSELWERTSECESFEESSSVSLPVDVEGVGERAEGAVGGGPVESLSDCAGSISNLDKLFDGRIDELRVLDILYAFLCQQPLRDGDIENVVSYIFNQAMIDASNAENIAKYLYMFSKASTFGRMLLRKLYTHMQKLYNEWVALGKVTEKNKNFTKMFVAIAHHMRGRDKTPIRSIVEDLSVLAERLVSSTREADVKLFTLCLIRLSSYEAAGLDGSNGDRLRQLVRTQISDGNNSLDSTSTAWLQLGLITPTLSDVARLPPAEIERYTNLLGPDFAYLLPEHEVIRVSKKYNSALSARLTDVSRIKWV